jgi:multicomponent Na+:H+ antiporter subunit B
VQVAFFLINLLAAYLLIRGHERPGGGFIAGLCTAISLVLLSLGITVEQTRRTIRWRSARIAAIGSLLVVATAAGPMFFGHPFFTHFHATTADLPLFGRITLSTTLLFDFGIYLIVVGVMAKILFAFGLSTAGKSAFVEGEEDLFSARFEEPLESGGDTAERGERNAR